MPQTHKREAAGQRQAGRAEERSRELGPFNLVRNPQSAPLVDSCSTKGRLDLVDSFASIVDIARETAYLSCSEGRPELSGEVSYISTV